MTCLPPSSGNACWLHQSVQREGGDTGRAAWCDYPQQTAPVRPYQDLSLPATRMCQAGTNICLTMYYSSFYDTSLVKQPSKMDSRTPFHLWYPVSLANVFKLLNLK